MDTLTHAISGAVIGAVAGAAGGRHTAGDARRRKNMRQNMRQAMLWGALYAAFPDSDFLMVFFVDTLTYLNEHRGLTHSLLLLPAWAMLLGAFGARFGPGGWRDMSLLAAAALAAHIFGDLITSYGTKFLAPLDETPYAFPITFIIDPFFTAILLAGAAVAFWCCRCWPAVVSGIVLLCYLSVQTWAHAQAEDFGRQAAQQRNIESPIVMAFPQPLSPMHWAVIIAHGNGYERSYIDLLESESRPAPASDAGFLASVQAAYRPREDAFWVHYPRWPEDAVLRLKSEQAWSQAAFAGFRDFALLPYVAAVRSEESRTGDSSNTGNALCIWFTDLRFGMPVRENPFRFAMCETAEGNWLLREAHMNGERLE